MWQTGKESARLLSTLKKKTLQFPGGEHFGTAIQKWKAGSGGGGMKKKKKKKKTTQASP